MFGAVYYNLIYSSIIWMTQELSTIPKGSIYQINVALITKIRKGQFKKGKLLATYAHEMKGEYSK